MVYLNKDIEKMYNKFAEFVESKTPEELAMIHKEVREYHLNDNAEGVFFDDILDKEWRKELEIELFIKSIFEDNNLCIDSISRITEGYVEGLFASTCISDSFINNNKIFKTWSKFSDKDEIQSSFWFEESIIWDISAKLQVDDYSKIDKKEISFDINLDNDSDICDYDGDSYIIAA